MRHYSKVFVHLPDSPSDPPFAVVEVDCDVCGKETIRTHVAHLGTLLRVLSQTVDAIQDDGTSQAFSGVLPDDPATKQRASEFLDRAFPQWKGDRIRKK